ncbi:MAG: TetR family transcriptional regulator C-terminal domain-containing protein [Haloplanus sp.]
MADSPTGADRSAAQEEIMEATYRALCDHGYADLTMQAIAAEYGKTTAAIHYHYETKEDLVVAFLEFILDRFIDHVHGVDTTDPEERLELLLDRLLTDREGYREFVVAMLELRAQAPYNDRIREQIQRNDEYVHYLLRTVIADGVAAGVFADVDPEAAARSLMTIVDGARTRFASLDERDALADARRTAAEYVESVLEAE